MQSSETFATQTGLKMSQLDACLEPRDTQFTVERIRASSHTPPKECGFTAEILSCSEHVKVLFNSMKVRGRTRSIHISLQDCNLRARQQRRFNTPSCAWDLVTLNRRKAHRTIAPVPTQKVHHVKQPTSSCERARIHVTAEKMPKFITFSFLPSH
jgi:hypothetical protein